MCDDVVGAKAPGVRMNGKGFHVQPTNQSKQTRPPLPPFTEETARQKVKMAQDAWNTRDPDKVPSPTPRTQSGATATSSSRDARRS